MNLIIQIILSILLTPVVIYGLVLLLFKMYCLLTLTYCKSNASLVGKTAVITGGSAGIGYQLVLGLASRGCKVIIAGRTTSPSLRDAIINETGNPNIFLKYVDLSSFQSVSELAANLNQSEKSLDILINNSGIVSSEIDLTEDGLETEMQVNYFSGFLLTHLLIDLLKKSSSARILFTSSLLSHIHWMFMNQVEPDKITTASPFFRYPNSKFCQIVASDIFARKLRPFGITCNSWHPHVVKTDILSSAVTNSAVFSTKVLFRLLSAISIACRTPQEAAQTGIYLACAKEVEGITGKFFADCRYTFKPRAAHNTELSQLIWKCSENVVKLKLEEKLN